MNVFIEIHMIVKQKIKHIKISYENECVYRNTYEAAKIKMCF